MAQKGEARNYGFDDAGVAEFAVFAFAFRETVTAMPAIAAATK
jgi:hypothetical protein